MVEESLVAILRDNVDVANLVGTKIYPAMAPEGTARPYVTYQRISTPRVYSTTGYSGCASPRIQFDCFADTYTQVRDLADAVRLALQAFRGTVLGVTIAAIFLDDEREPFEEPFEGHDRPVRRVTMDFFVWHSEEKPLQPA